MLNKWERKDLRSVGKKPMCSGAKVLAKWQNMVSKRKVKVGLPALHLWKWAIFTFLSLLLSSPPPKKKSKVKVELPRQCHRPWHLKQDSVRGHHIWELGITCRHEGYNSTLVLHMEFLKFSRRPSKNYVRIYNLQRFKLPLQNSFIMSEK